MRLPVLLCLLLALPVQAADFQSVASIRAAALSTLDPATEAEASVDAGLRLPACPAPLQARATGNRTVEVACPQAGGWKTWVLASGSELRLPLGISVIGGLMLSQVITLYTTPVIYLAFEDLRGWVTGRAPRAQPAE